MVSDKERTYYGMKLKSPSIYVYSYNVTGQRDNEINLSGPENYTIGHSSDVENIWFHDDE